MFSIDLSDQGHSTDQYKFWRFVELQFQVENYQLTMHLGYKHYGCQMGLSNSHILTLHDQYVS